MRIVYINLDGATERRAFMEEQGARLGLPLERLAAVSADDVSDETAHGIGRAWERPLTRAELACFLSHETVWRQVARESEPALVLEDDVRLAGQLTALLPRLTTLAEIDLLNLESFDRKRIVARRARPLGDVAIVRTYRDKAGAAAYVLWPSGARKLLARARLGAAPADAFIHSLKRLVSYQVEPALAMQLHILKARGIEPPIRIASSVQASRQRLALTRENLPFHVRRLITQVKLAGEHVMRLFGRRYRRTLVDDRDFQPRSAADHSRS
ncbi:glycosyltransferase family 25 protein [Aurantimonas marianensis]|uniref:Glycosyltransferase family 25 protein n=1 Tax=Aurantimonas marianensis TaxID=2920428 RepID=A0A9X2KET9_9HYPH|nr:glycosyltransferase family 25 protein [Aurantimonas marianensis]MCP3055044.1 glycosyltransferase family 25 protein [Aurantimonas marianensis]